MTKIQLPANERAFAELRERARAGAGKASAPKPTSADQGPEAEIRMGEFLDATERANVARDKKRAESSGTTPPPTLAELGISKKESARVPEKAKVEETPELESDEVDLHSLFFPVGRR